MNSEPFNSPEKFVQHRLSLFKTRRIAFFCGEVVQLLLNGEELVAEVEPLADVLGGGVALDDGFERLVKLVPRMGLNPTTVISYGSLW